MEEQVQQTARERLRTLEDGYARIEQELPLDTAFVADSALVDLPNSDLLGGIRDVLESLNQDARQIADRLADVIERANERVGRIREAWVERRAEADEIYQATLRELQATNVDGEEFIRLRRRIEALKPLKEDVEKLEREQEAVRQRRRNLLAEWEEIKRAEYAGFERAAKQIDRELKNTLRIDVAFEGDRTPLIDLLDEEIDGRRKRMLESLGSREGLSLRNLADACRQGASRIQEEYGLTAAQAEKLAGLTPEVCMRIEELELPAATEFELNISAPDRAAEWRKLKALSTGQRATAVLLLLLLDSHTPLVVDQPENDLDNRFVADGVVPAIREGKGRRQFILATHNANIPVLGDAELILGLSPRGEAGRGRAEIRDEHRGAIDQESVRDLVEELLEGGKDAFERRRAKYGF